LPRRFTPRNDGVGVDCHVVSLLAMTGIRVIASRRRSNPAFVLHHLKNRLPRRFTPRNDEGWVDWHIALLLAITGSGLDLVIKN